MKKYKFNISINNLIKFNKMKKNNFFKMVLPILAAVMLTAFKCGGENEPSETVSLHHVWTLSLVRGGFNPSFTYNRGEILWTVSKNDTIYVSNNSNTYPLPSVNDGYYKYSNTSDSITLDETFSYKYKLTNDSLILFDGEIAADGKEFIFVKFNGKN
jgi:hypothetical protein